jgi:hypothetical protein
MMTSSLINADRSAHMKIIATALIAASLVVIVGLTARLADTASQPPHGGVAKASSVITVTSGPGSMVR